MSRTPPAGPGPSQRPIDEPPSRRDALRLIGGAALGALAPAPALAQAPMLSQIQSALGEGQRFEPAAVVELARALAKRPYAAVPADLPEALTNLNYEQYIGIRALPQAPDLGRRGPRLRGRAAASRLGLLEPGAAVHRRGRERAPDRL